MLNYLLTKASPPFAKTKQGRSANGNHLLNAGLWVEAGTDGVGLFAISHAVIPPRSNSYDENQNNLLSDPLSKTTQATQAWKAAVPPTWAGHRCVFWITWVNKLANIVTWITMWLIQPSQPLCARTKPTPSAGQDPTLPGAWWPPGQSAGPTCFTPGNFTWSSCNHLFCAKLKQCVVLACCILYKNPFLPTPPSPPLFKTFI